MLRLAVVLVALTLAACGGTDAPATAPVQTYRYQLNLCVACTTIGRCIDRATLAPGIGSTCSVPQAGGAAMWHLGTGPCSPADCREVDASTTCLHLVECTRPM